jgi:glycosyltransferase involved in cell wall biosynthesis
VTYVGFQADPGPIYAASDVLVVPSTRLEPFGRVAVEAGHYGLPVVASGHGGLREIVRHNENGILVEPGSHAALAAALTRLIQNGDLRRRLGTAAEQSALGHSVASVADQYLKLYREIVLP